LWAALLATAAEEVAMLEPPGPRGTELFSVLNDWRKNGLVAAERLAQRYGDVVCAKFPGRRAYLLNHPDYIRRVLIDNRGNYPKPSASKNTRRYFGNAMQLSNGETALGLRRVMSPAFSRRG
jgi:cytochrome P450